MRRLGVQAKQLAERAEVNYATYYRGLHMPGSTSVRNVDKLSRALIAMEIELRDYLVALHPLDTPKMEAAE